MNTLVSKRISKQQLSQPAERLISDASSVDTEVNHNSVNRFFKWFRLGQRRNHASLSKGRMVFGSTIIDESNRRSNRIMSVDEVSFVIPRRLEEILREGTTEQFEKARLNIRRMDEYLVAVEDSDETEQQKKQKESAPPALSALMEITNKMQKAAFSEILDTKDTLSVKLERTLTSSSLKYNPSGQQEKIDAITDFQEAHDIIEFDQLLLEHDRSLLGKEPYKISDMFYLKFCLMFELQRDEQESCLRIILHDIIFKYHLTGFRLRCEMHIKKPTEHELSFEKILPNSHLKANYSAQCILWSGDWVEQQEVELHVFIKIESLSINKYIGSKFSDTTNLHVKNVPHGASKIFLRELTPFSRSHKVLSRGINFGQIEIEAAYWSDRHELTIFIIKITHSQAERLFKMPETYVEIIFQSPFDVYETQRTKIARGTLNPKFDEEFLFQLPDSTAIGDITVDLIFLEKPSLSHRPRVLGVLTLSKHTDWYPVRRFWTDVEENPNVKLKDSFKFESSIY